ncbi:MAG: sulfite exporter TauE/SafE family protein [Rhizobiaceae bacterium]|nr:sulfite exporter TauE/SafE family protein [Rhizobiaceae bacterium]
MGALELFLPDGVSLAAACILILASFFTSALTASFGVGGGVAMLALLGVFVPVSVLIPVHGAVQLGSNTGRAWIQRQFIRMDLARPFLVGTVIGAIVGAFVVVQLPDALMKIVLGLFVVLVTWTRIPGIDRIGRSGLGIASSILALVTMMVGATGPLVSPILAQFIPDNRKALVATHAACMFIQQGLKIVVFGLAGFAFGDWLPMVAAMVFTGYLGTQYGSKLLDRLPEEQFRKWFRIGLTLLAFDLVRRGLMAVV